MEDIQDNLTINPTSNIQADARDVGRIVKYFVLGTILHSLVFSGSIIYLLSTVIGYIFYLMMYPVRSVFSDFSGFNIGLNSIWNSTNHTAHAAQKFVTDTTVHNLANVNVVVGDTTAVLSNVAQSQIDYTTTIGKIIRALIGR
jgi:hypothetical protein